MKKLMTLLMLVSGKLFAQNQSTVIQERILPDHPQIIYKVDTIQYVNKFYKVANGGKVVDLLKKLKGFEIGPDGKITHQGQDIKKIKLNGRDYKVSGSVSALPDILASKLANVQIIDDYNNRKTLNPKSFL